MTTATTVSGRAGGLRAVSVLAGRELRAYRNAPVLLVVSLLAPLGMMLMFGFVFGGALGGGDSAAYRNYLVPGVLVLVCAMSLPATALLASTDINSGFSDRVDALPLPRLAAPAGVALAETAVGVVALALMAVLAVAMGWRPDAGWAEAALAVVLMLGLRLAFAWLGVLLGSVVRDEQVLQQVAPLVFAAIMFSNVFVPTSTMPAVVRAIAEWNPVSSAVAALRTLLGSNPGDGGAWPLDHPVPAAFAWVAVLLLLSVVTTAFVRNRD